MQWPGEDMLAFRKDHFENYLEWAFDQGASDILLESGERVGMI